MFDANKWKHRANHKHEGKSLVDVYVSLPNWKRAIWCGGFVSFNDAGEFMLDCIGDDSPNVTPTYSAKVNLPELRPIRELRPENDDGYLTLWCRVPGTLSDKEAIAFWDGHGLDAESTYCQHEYDCCGRFYHGDLRIRRSGHSTLLTQYFTRNV